MIKNINFSEFCDTFKSHDRQDQFSYNGKRALFDYLENMEDETSTPIELDVVALCCEYSEYDSAWDAMKEYQPEDMPVESDPGDDLVEIQEKNEKEALRWLEDHTQVIPVEGGKVIILQF